MNKTLLFSFTSSATAFRARTRAILLGLLISVPIGWVVYRYARNRSALLALTGILYVIPSLALFALLPPLLGISFLSETNLSIALTIYAVATMTQFAAYAFGSVSPQTRSAATAVGYSGWGRFWKVKLPLADREPLAGRGGIMRSKGAQ